MCWYLSRALVAVIFSISILVIFGFSQEADAASPVCGNEIIERPVEQCDPPNDDFCNDNCEFIIAGGNTIEGETQIEPLCGIVKNVDGEPANNAPIIFPGPVVNNQVSSEQSAEFANTGGGPGRVDITEVEFWKDINLDDVFSGCNTRFHYLADQAYADMRTVCGGKGSDQTYIDVLPAQTEEPSVSVERFHKVRPTIAEEQFMTVDTVTTTQILELTISCDPPATCDEDEFLDNGECVFDDDE